MANATHEPAGDKLSPLEAQVRDCYGRVVYSHKIHEKAADIYLQRLHRLKLGLIAISAVTTGTLLYALFGSNQMGTLIGALLSAGLFALNTYTKDFDLGELAQKHKEAANRLWAIRESYFSLLTDMAMRDVSVTEVRTKRDDLQKALEFVYHSAPNTHDAAYEKARRALKTNEELTFEDGELDQFLPNAFKHSRTS